MDANFGGKRGLVFFTGGNGGGQLEGFSSGALAGHPNPLNPKTKIEPRITRIDTDYEEVVEMIPKPV
jgi:hypothetical protein